MKKILSLILCVFMLTFMFSACASAEDDELVMYTNAAFPPFEYITNGNEVAGVDVEIANAIAAELGKTLKIENVDFDGIILGINNGQADMGIAGMTITEERLESVNFSIPYTTSVQYIIVKEGADVTTIEDLAGMKIGVQRGTTGDFIVSDEVNGYEDEDGNDVMGVLQDTDAEVIQFKSAPEAALSLTTDKIDAVVIDKLPAENITTENEGLQTFELTYSDGSVTVEEYAVAVAKDNEELLNSINTVIEKLIADGSIDAWIVEHSNETTN